MLLHLPQVDKDLAYLQEGTRNFDDYVFAVNWAQKFARLNRDIMMSSVIMAARACPDMPTFDLDPKSKAVNCHHNYVNVENHFGKEVFLTRKGAVSGLSLSSTYLETFQNIYMQSRSSNEEILRNK